MSTCILTGFAKKKHKVGTSYACNGSDLPATQDLGTTVFQGPSETPYAVPATEVSYTIIGSTPCGGTIRRISTKTYSSRSFANGYKYLDGEMNPNAGGFPVHVGSSGVVIGQTVNDVFTAIAYACFSTLASSYTFTNAGVTYLFNNKRLEIGPSSYYIARYDYYVNGVLQAGTNGYFPNVIGALSRPTIYYLDVTEVITYDLV